MIKINLNGKSSKYLGIAVLAAICFAAWTGRSDAQQGSASVSVKADEIGGVVTSSKGPEAGVWVIAETTDLPTRYIKEVVTDDRGRYLIPACPRRNTRCGRAATAWWIRRRCKRRRASPSI